jgi:type IV pilus assembly protein PilE
MTHHQARTAPRKQIGFTLIELLIAAAIIAIVAAVAIPSYAKHVSKSRRADGMAELTRVMQRQEKYFINTLSYSADLGDLGLIDSAGKVESEGGHYLIEAKVCDGSTIARCVALIAQPVGPQADDGWLSLTSRGERDWEGNTGGKTGWP